MKCNNDHIVKLFRPQSEYERKFTAIKCMCGVICTTRKATPKEQREYNKELAKFRIGLDNLFKGAPTN